MCQRQRDALYGSFPGRARYAGRLNFGGIGTGWRYRCFLCGRRRRRLSGRIGYFTGVNNARFKGMVKPGDVLVLRTEIVKKKGPIFVADATAKVDGKLVCKAEIMFAIA